MQAPIVSACVGCNRLRGFPIGYMGVLIMYNIVLDIITISLAVFGGICLFFSVINFIYKKTKFTDTDISFILLVKNQEEVIEGIIRNYFEYDPFNKNFLPIKLSIVDMGSQDNTIEIIEKLQKEYVNLGLYKEGEKDKIFQAISSNINVPMQ